MSVQVKFRLDPRFLESSPYQENWQDIGIDSVVFRYNVLGSANFDERSGQQVQEGNRIYYEGTLELDANTDYQVRVRVTNSQGTVSSSILDFDTADTEVYYNYEVVVRDANSLDPINGAELTLYEDSGYTNILDISRPSVDNGRAWIQRVPSGNYYYTISASGYDQEQGVFAGTEQNQGNMGFVDMTPSI